MLSLLFRMARKLKTDGVPVEKTTAGHDRGFTAMEIMIAVSIIGLLAVIAMPSLIKARFHAQNATFIHNLKAASAAFEQYTMSQGDFPENAGPGIMPGGMSEYMPRRIHWTSPTTIGGQWDWDRAPSKTETIFGCYAGVSVYRPERTSVEMQGIDAKIDDGDLSTGIFRSREDGYIYILEK